MPSISGIRKAVSDAIAKNPELAKGIAGGTMGALGGGLMGKYVTPQAFGYADNPDATSMSTFLDAALYGTLGALGGSGKLKTMDPKTMLGLAASMPAAELAPVGMDLLTKGRAAVTEGSKSMREMAEASKGIRPNKSFTEQISDVLSSPAARGAAGGAALAGLGAMTTGLTRPQTEAEREANKSRYGMVTSDFLKYVIPSMIAGGTLGHMTKKPEQGEGLPS